ncbi:MAG TPA: nucleotidyltransferase domain-containing protein [Acidimicrobiales bacterium]|nr:nucleotidyltransferase domain-containing protein [Acidimicrobiales bacterium]
MLPSAVGVPVDEFLRDLEEEAGGLLAGAYLVGSSALGDFSPRFSNVDVVVVTDPPADPPAVSRMRRAEGRLHRAGRSASVWYTAWEDLASGDPSGGGGRLDTPMTRAILRDDAVTLTGPDWPVVAFDDETFRRWCQARLAQVADQAQGLMVFRRGVVPVVLEAARLAEGALSGRVLSKCEAGQIASRLVKSHFRRILTDAVGYRQGATTSMYWGPFERKYDAREVVRHLAAAAGL